MWRWIFCFLFEREICFATCSTVLSKSVAFALHVWGGGGGGEDWGVRKVFWCRAFVAFFGVR